MQTQGRILVVEDQKNWQDMLKTLLEEQGYSVSIAPEFGEAKRLLQRQMFDLAVLDIRLDESDPHNVQGMELIEKVERYGDETRIVMLTGYGTVQLARDAFKEHDVTDFLEKQTFNSEEFKALVRRSIEGVMERRKRAPVAEKRRELLQTAMEFYRRAYSAITQREAQYLEWVQAVGGTKIEPAVEAAQRRKEYDLEKLEEMYSELRRKIGQARSLEELEAMELEVIKEGERWITSFSMLPTAQVRNNA